MNIFGAGAKVFQKEARTKSQVSHKFIEVSGECLTGQMTKRVMAVEKEDILELLKSREFVLISELSEKFQEDLLKVKSHGLGQFKLVYTECEKFKLELMGFVGDFKVKLELAYDQEVVAKFLLGEKCL